jgi:cation:H+ antiporter
LRVRKIRSRSNAKVSLFLFGGLFVLLYVSYTLCLVLASTQHDAAEGFSTIMLWFVLPLVAATLIAITSYELGILKERKAARLAKQS